MDQQPHSTSADQAAGDLTPDQVRLVDEKMVVLQQARELQGKLASVRGELTRIDAEMLKTGFKIPVLACW